MYIFILSTLTGVVQGDSATSSQIESNLKQLIANIGNSTDEEKIWMVNAFFNKHVRFRNDIDIWQQQDYWATPKETMQKGQGDCEDFAIAKYVVLLKMNVPMDKLRLIYVRARTGGEYGNTSQAHMVLGYYSSPDAEPLILDNLLSEIYPAHRRTDLTPIFSFNSSGLWAQGKKASSSPSSKLSRWRNLLSRIQAEES